MQQDSLRPSREEGKLGRGKIEEGEGKQGGLGHWLCLGIKCLISHKQDRLCLAKPPEKI